MQKKRWAQAADGFRAAARLAPKDPDPQLYLAVILGDHLDQLDQARLHLERYKELGGKEPSALAWLAQLSAPAK
jgi:Flp pilus assembly protein TadD